MTCYLLTRVFWITILFQLSHSLRTFHFARRKTSELLSFYGRDRDFIDQRRIAILIDGDNAESSLINEYLAETGRFGKVSVIRIYADWTSPQMRSWKDQINSYAIRPIQKFAYTKNKSSTDTALIIDAMDLLHSKRVDGFCICSSDSDYTGLAQRIREEGLFMMGIGRSHTPDAFVKSCEIFVNTEILKQQVMKQTEKKIVYSRSSITNQSAKINESDNEKSENKWKVTKVQSETVTETNLDEDKSEQSVTSSSSKRKGRAYQINWDLIDTAYSSSAGSSSGLVFLSKFHDALKKLDRTFSHKKFGYSTLRRFCDVELKSRYKTVTSHSGSTVKLMRIKHLSVDTPANSTLLTEEIEENEEEEKEEEEREIEIDESDEGEGEGEETDDQLLVNTPSTTVMTPTTLSLPTIPEIDMRFVDRAFKMAVDIDTGHAMLSRLAESLRKLDPTFDHRNYGYSSFRKFCDSLQPEYSIFTGKQNILYMIESKSNEDNDDENTDENEEEEDVSEDESNSYQLNLSTEYYDILRTKLRKYLKALILSGRSIIDGDIDSHIRETELSLSGEIQLSDAQRLQFIDEFFMVHGMKEILTASDDDEDDDEDEEGEGVGEEEEEVDIIDEHDYINDPRISMYDDEEVNVVEVEEEIMNDATRHDDNNTPVVQGQDIGQPLSEITISSLDSSNIIRREEEVDMQYNNTNTMNQDTLRYLHNNEHGEHVPVPVIERNDTSTMPTIQDSSQDSHIHVDIDVPAVPVIERNDTSTMPTIQDSSQDSHIHVDIDVPAVPVIERNDTSTMPTIQDSSQDSHIHVDIDVPVVGDPTASS